MIFIQDLAIIGLKGRCKMNEQKKISNKSSSKSMAGNVRPHFSKAVLDVAKKNLKEFESQSEEAFLVRADMDRKLSSL